MLHYFKLADLVSGLQVASRFDNDIASIRENTTLKINGYIRRNLEFVAGMIEYFDTPNLRHGEGFNIWLEKKEITAIALAYSRVREWDDYPLEDTQFLLDPVKGKLTVYGYLRAWRQGLRIVYDGGYPALGDDATTMACPAALKNAALIQARHDARRIFSGDEGTQTDDDKKTPVIMRGNLLKEVADAFQEFRRPLGS